MDWKLIGVAAGLAVALLFGFAIAGNPQDLINVLLIALPHSVVITLINALLFVHLASQGGASQGGASPAGAIIGGLVGGIIGAIESIIVWRLSPTMPVLVAGGIAAVAYLLALVRTFLRPIWDRVSGVIIRVLDFQIGLPTPKAMVGDPKELYYRPYPRKLQINVPALILGPVWYLLAGLWVHASILLSLLFLTGGALAPIVWLYCGLKANEDLLEFRIARHNVY